MKTIELFRDPRFEGNFGIHGPRHEDGHWAVYPGIRPQADKKWDWDIGQWGSYKHPLTKDTPRTDLANGGYCYETESYTLTVHPDDDCKLRMELRSSAEYEGHVRVFGEDWPHFLIGQGMAWREQPSLNCYDEIRLHSRLRIAYCDNKMASEAYNTELHGSQVHQFITLYDPKNDDFIWFGVPYFDIREPGLFPGFMGIDGGKADASGKLIYTTTQDHYLAAPVKVGEWMEYDVDLLPLFREAFDVAKEKGLLRRSRWEDLRVSSTNIGFEMFGEFDAAVELGEMSLTGKISRYEFFRDPHGANGLMIHGPRHEDGYWATYPGFRGRSKETPVWEIAQWGSYKHPLDKDSVRTELSGGGYRYDSDTNTVTVLPGDDSFDLRLEIRTTHEYEGYIRKEGDDWPHLLAEQHFGDKLSLPSMGDIETLHYHCSYRLDYFRNYMDMSKYNFEDHVAQTHHYFTVHDAHSDEYFWFGLPYFDNRHRSFPGYLHIDCGKADATGMMIRTVPQKLLTEQCAMDGGWITVDTDLMPLLREAFATAQTQGVLKGVNFDEMRLTSANFGFEMFAEYNAAFELKDVQVTAILKT